jgi:peroxiredoxin
MKLILDTTYKMALALLACGLPLTLRAAPPKVGDTAPGFTLKTLDDQTVRLSDLTATGKVVLVVLRGWPGYQCPLCSRQVQDYIASSTGFKTAKARVVMVYPGPAADLKAHATEFLKNKQWPQEFVYLIDPGFSMVNAYTLRWDAPGETVYPSTFVLDQKGVVRLATISHDHDNRTKAADIIAELQRMGSD